ncbi:MAG: hypothetical protein WC456_03400 [Patescibacteria group bacterium]
MVKKIIAFTITLSLCSVFLLSSVSAQLLTNTDQGLLPMTETTRKAANFSDMPIENIIARVIQVILGFLATVFIILMIIAGFRWLTARGNEEMVTEAQGTIRNAIIGLAVVLMAYAITYFIFKYMPFSGGSGALQSTISS